MFLSRVRIAFAFSIIALLMVASAGAQTSKPKSLDVLNPKPQAEVLILGTYHMSNPGRDILNMQADDVRSPKRQEQMKELAAVLERFRPTKIALEWGTEDQQRLDRLYNEYLDGKHELNANETQQVGFRVGKQVGLKKLYAIDVESDFPFGAVQNWAKANGHESELDAILKQGKERVIESNEYLKTHSVLEMLRRMNSGAYVRDDAGWYALAAHFGDDGDPAGAELLTQWYRRNTRIHNNLLGIIEPGDRVLVLYGAGHLTLLRRFVQDDPTLQLHTLEDLVDAAKK